MDLYQGRSTWKMSNYLSKSFETEVTINVQNLLRNYLFKTLVNTCNLPKQVALYSRVKMGVLTYLHVYCFVIPKMILFNLFMRIVYLINPEKFKSKGGDKAAITEGWMASNRFLKAVLRGAKFQATRESVENGPAIDVDLYDLSSKSTVRLFDFMKANRPLVVNFGSCT